MKPRHVVILSAGWIIAASAGAEKMRSAGNQPRVPPVDIIQAVRLTLDHHKKEYPDAEEVFVDEARYVRSEAEPFWKIGLRLKARETGHLFFKVKANGHVQILAMMKDG